MHTIEVDFDVFKELTVRRATEDVTSNDVLRALLDLEPAEKTKIVTGTADGKGAWWVKGVVFPEGTEFRARYKGQIHWGKVQNGALIVHSKRYNSPSAAAVAITGGPVNGWNFWQARLPGQSEWQVIAGLRK